MFYLRKILLSLNVIAIGGCTDLKLFNANDSRVSYESLGGQKIDGFICPKSVRDVIVKLENLNSIPIQGEPDMTIMGLKKFIDCNNIRTITELLNFFPEHYRNNFSLVETTKGEGQSSLEYPRIVLFGPDGRFLVNISTKSDDPKYNLLDCAELNNKNGLWEFSQFDFTESNPILYRNEISCFKCHGDKPRPIWGNNLDWPGVFGDNEAAGPNGEALSYRHALRMNKIKIGNGGSDRFDFLQWDQDTLNSGGIRRIVNNVFGAELLVSNMQIGTATARGVFLRMLKEHPEVYVELREVFLILGYEHMFKNILSNEEKSYIYSHYNLNSLSPIRQLFFKIGIDIDEAFSLSTLAKSETPKPNWSLGAGTLYDLVLLQILDDLANTDNKIEEILSAEANVPGIFKCPDLGVNILEVVEFKMLHLFHLRGKSRYDVNKVYYPQDVENIKEKVFAPAYNKLMPYLKSKVLKDVNS